MFDLRLPLIETRTAELRRRAEAARRARRHRSAAGDATVTIRRVTDHDPELGAVARLAALDSRPVPARPVLVAEVDGELQAAVSLADGAAVADPFRPTAEVVGLLRVRASQLA